jgi:hypothetical protein
MKFHQKLDDSLTKERGGQHGGKGHEFQRYWALCHLLKIDTEQDDYVLLMEFIEDVAVLNAENDPTQMALYQIKKNEGSLKWSRNDLSKAPSSKKSESSDSTTPPKNQKSILAKLYESKRRSPDGHASIAFVSNAPVDLQLNQDKGKSTAYQEFCADEIEDSIKTELRNSIAKELSCSEGDIELSALKFIKSPLAIDDLENHATGQVSSYLAKKFPDHSARADVFCKALYVEIKIKATATQHAGNFDELRKIRGISKRHFEFMLSETLSRKSNDKIIEDVIAALVQENVPFKLRKEINSELRRFLVDKAGGNATILASLEQEIKDHCGNVPKQLESALDMANWIAEKISTSSHAAKFSMFDQTYLLAVILFWIC